MRHLGLEAALAMAMVSVHASKRRTVAVNEAPRQQTEIEVWNAAVEARKAAKKARRMKEVTMNEHPNKAAIQAPEHCQCNACKGGAVHASDCAVHNAPALPVGPCDCHLHHPNPPKEQA